MSTANTKNFKLTNHGHSRVIVIQPALPEYRLNFFNAAAELLGHGLAVYASDLDLGVLTRRDAQPRWFHQLGAMRRLFFGAEWQVGALAIPIAIGDIVVVSGAPRCISNLLLLISARLRGARTIWWGQLWSATTARHRFLLRLVLMRLAHGVLFYTDSEVANYRSKYGRRDYRPVAALNNGIDVEPIKRLRRTYRPDERLANVLFIGRITEKSNLGLLLCAMAQPQVNHATLHVIGDGPNAVALQRWARENGLDGRVQWHGGLVDESLIAKVANRCALFCYPGAVGLSLIHAMAYGLPALVHSSTRSHMPEIAAFEADKTGLDFVADDSVSLAGRLEDLLADPQGRLRMSRQARERADSTYNTQAMAQRLVAFVGAVR